MEQKSVSAEPVQVPPIIVEAPPKPSTPLKKATFPIGIVILLIIVAVLSASATFWIVKGYPMPFYINGGKNPVSSQPTNTPSASSVDTSTWKTYTSTEGGFSLKYPPTVLFNEEAKGAKQLVLDVSVDKVSDIPEDLPMNMGRNNVIATRALLQNEGEGTIKIGSLNGLVRSVHSQFEVCSVIFTRSLTFFQGDYRIIISLLGPRGPMEASMPDFFVIDPKNCGTEFPMWITEKRDVFDDTLKRKEGKGMAQEWYDTFDAIVQTVELQKVLETSSPTKATVAVTTVPSVSPTSSCDVSDSAFCNIVNNLKIELNAKNYAGFLAYQLLQSTTCDPDGMFVAICEGAPKGAIREGYGIGYNQSEGTLVSHAAYLSTIGSYVNTNGPFTYKGSMVSGDKAVAVFLNSDRTKIMVFPMGRTGATWRMNHILLGGDYGGEFANMKQSILETVQ